MGRRGSLPDPPHKYDGNFVLCKGEKEICEGTIEEIAALRGKKVETIKYYLTDAYKRKINKSNNPDNRLCLIPLDYDLEDY